jgi:hypothetical protein
MAIEYAEFVAQAKRMRDQLVATATEEADKWLASTLAMVRRMRDLSAEDTPLSGASKPDTSHTDQRGRDRPTLSSVARQAIESLGTKEFDSVKLRELIAPNYPMDSVTPRANLANLLKRFVEKGELELIEQGTGSRPSRYRKKGTEMPLHQG